MRTGTWNGMSNGERGTGNGERGTGNGERETGNGERGTGNGERGTGNGERGKGNFKKLFFFFLTTMTEACDKLFYFVPKTIRDSFSDLN